MKSGTYSSVDKLRLRRASALFVCGVLLLWPPLLSAQQNAPPKRVLVIYWDTKDIPANVSFDQSFQAALPSDLTGKVEYYAEYLDSNRFPGENQEEFLHDYLRRKYAGHNIDVVVASPDPSLNFLLKYRADLFPNCPLVAITIQRPPSESINAGPGLTGIIRASTHRKTVDLALRLHPDTEQLFVISGTPERDKRFETAARAELSGYENRVRLTYLTDLPLNELIARTKSLPPRSVILYVWQRSLNEQEKLLQTTDVLASFAPSASAPIYGMGSRNVGFGLVGGYVQDSEVNGTKVAELVTRILKGTRAQDIPFEPAPSAPVFDWRQLRRWGISEDGLPPDSVVRFRELTFWGQYRWRIIGILALIALQTSFIAVLLIERRRRQRATQALDQLNTELEQRIAARTAALDNKSRELETFAYSVAHDLKAPLRGIDGYSRLLLDDYAGSLDDEGRSFLNIIQNSTEEMSQLIDDLLAYSRLERREFKPDRFELRPLITRLVEQKRREVAERSIEFVVDVNGVVVEADSNGLMQSLGNYLDNAVKFTCKVPQPRIEVGSKVTMTNCLLWVRDNGVGFDMKYHHRIFDIFQRLNPAEDFPGTGIGLAIVRKAMERMGGRAWAESEPGRGATFYLEIPKKNRSEVDL